MLQLFGTPQKVKLVGTLDDVTEGHEAAAALADSVKKKPKKEGEEEDGQA